MRKSLLLLVLVLVQICYANENTQYVHALYTYKSDDKSESPEQAYKKAIERAKLEALISAYGEDIGSTNIMDITNVNDGNSQESETRFYAHTHSNVRGVWLETLEEKKISQSYVDDYWIVVVEVRGKAREKQRAGIDLQAMLVTRKNEFTMRSNYKNGDEIYLRFRSPVSGYLCVYLVDEEQMAVSLLPYTSSATGSEPIDANRDYLFFDTYNNHFELRTTKTCEKNILYIIFSTKYFTKAIDSQHGDMNGLPYRDFIEWLNKVQTQDESLIVKEEIITINK